MVMTCPYRPTFREIILHALELRPHRLVELGQAVHSSRRCSACGGMDRTPTQLLVTQLYTAVRDLELDGKVEKKDGLYLLRIKKRKVSKSSPRPKNLRDQESQSDMK